MNFGDGQMQHINIFDELKSSKLVKPVSASVHLNRQISGVIVIYG